MSLALRYVPAGFVPGAARGRSAGLRGLMSYGLTVVRLPVGILIGVAVLRQDLGAVIALVIAFVTLDVYDGKIARMFGVETGARRATDGVLDKVCLHIAIACASVAVPAMLPIWMALIVRDVAQGAVGFGFTRRSGLIAAGASWHRPYSLVIAAWGIGSLYAGRSFEWLGLIAIAYGVAVLLDYTYQTEQFLRTGNASPAGVSPSDRPRDDE